MLTLIGALLGLTVGGQWIEKSAQAYYQLPI
jgi:hypothetical protein